MAFQPSRDSVSMKQTLICVALSLPLHSCVTSGKLLSLSVPHAIKQGEDSATSL